MGMTGGVGSLDIESGGALGRAPNKIEGFALTVFKKIIFCIHF